ncbi:hypothetical protein vseg_010005 [Gypsophila vaccaria]
MKGIDLSCASPASTAICTNIDQRSVIKHSTKSLHRFNSYLGDHYKNIANTYSPSRAPCISELPFTPRPSSFSSYRDKTTRKLGASGVNHSDVMTRRRRSSADITDLKRVHSRDSCHSTRYLLGESRYLDSLSEKETSKKHSTPVFGASAEARKSTGGVDTRRFGTLLDDEKEKIRKHFSLIDVGGTSDYDQRKHKNAGETFQRHNTSMHMTSCSTNDSLLHKPPSPHQVVVLRVSLHCRGCENKLRKHLSKMQGVTKYNIDMETKKVTVTGNVTPLEVLTSISKVKNAQFWPSQASSSSSTSSSSSSSSSTTIDLN